MHSTLSLEQLTNVTKKQREKYLDFPLEKKISLAESIIYSILSTVEQNQTAIAWTGGKDSTLLLWLIRRVCLQNKWSLPKCMFVDEGDVFDEIRTFVDQLTHSWSLDVDFAHNTDVSSKVSQIGDEITVSDLNRRNQKEIKRLNFDKPTFPYQPESYVGNHLMKTVATNMWLEDNKITHLFVGVRWDEQGARSEDNFLRLLEEPKHHRVEPILHIKERDVWDITKQYDIPYVSLYSKGYRSLGAKETTSKVSDTPAWEQDIENTTERAGRQQDKEKIMAKLRALGYM